MDKIPHDVRRADEKQPCDGPSVCEHNEKKTTDLRPQKRRAEQRFRCEKGQYPEGADGKKFFGKKRHHHGSENDGSTDQRAIGCEFPEVHRRGEPERPYCGDRAEKNSDGARTGKSAEPIRHSLRGQKCPSMRNEQPDTNHQTDCA